MSGASFRASNTQQGLTENMQILTGQKGDRLDKALTLREAAALGMVNLRRNGSGQIVPELPPDKPTDPEWSGVQQPVAPTGVTADGAFHTITLTWDTPAYKGHSYAEVLRAEVDNPSSAIAIGTTLSISSFVLILDKFTEAKLQTAVSPSIFSFSTAKPT